MSTDRFEVRVLTYKQRVLTLLDTERKGVERVHCTYAELQSVWARAFLDVAQEG